MGAKLKMTEMKRITVTLPDQIAEALEDWASQQGRPTANLASFLIEQGIIQAQEKGLCKVATPQATTAK